MGDDEVADDSFCAVDNVLTTCACLRTGPTVKAEVDGDNEAQTAASKRVFPFVVLLRLFPLLRSEDRDGLEEGIVPVVLSSLSLDFE